MQEQEEKIELENNSTFGYDPIKDKEKIAKLRRWYTCSFCGRPSECRPHAPLEGFEEMKIFPMRLCFYCATIQDNVRQMIQSILKKDGN